MAGITWHNEVFSRNLASHQLRAGHLARRFFGTGSCIEQALPLHSQFS